MTEDTDILAIDEKIHKKFQEERSKLNMYKNKLLNLKETYNNSSDLSPNIKNTIEANIIELETYINDLENNITRNYYILETAEIIEEYRNLLKIPIKINFMGKCNTNNKEKKRLYDSYIKYALKYINFNNVDLENATKTISKLENKKEKLANKKEQANQEKKNSNKITCNNPFCSNKKDFELVENNIYVCSECFSQQTINKDSITSYGDIDRVNISSKYVYDRKIHFRDCINQYQGKQNCTIPQKVYDDLERQFELHHLLNGDKNVPKEIRFSNITKNHIMMFLHELDYSKHYENVHLIHYMFTGTKPDDISHLEDQLLNDFDILTELYDKKFKHIKRKNFINTQYVLYQLLHKYKHPCKIDKSLILTTNDRRNFHESILFELFIEAGWNTGSSFY